jgi:hypothetical protein
LCEFKWRDTLFRLIMTLLRLRMGVKEYCGF